MPPTVYDSSLLTQRNRMKAVSGSFLNRISSNNTSYAPALGIWDQSIINSVKNGQMTYFRKGSSSDNGCPCNIPVICPFITLNDIATFNGDYWFLNNNTTILECQTLEIPNGIILRNNEYKFINYGKIINTGTIGLNEIINYGTIINNNTIEMFGINCINNGSIINNGILFIMCTINNIGTITNNGTVINNMIIYNYNNGTIVNNGTYTENGTLNNANGLSTCGVGILIGTIMATGTACPP